MTWPLRPNWASPYVERFSFMTEIITSDSGREQRRALRVAARHSVQYEALATREQMRARRRQVVRQSDLLIFPDEVRFVFTTAAASADDVVIVVDATPTWLGQASHLVLEAPGSKERVGLPVQGIVGSTVTLGDIVGRTWPKGTKVFLGMPGRLSPSLTTTFRTNNITEGSVEMMVDPGKEVQPVGFAPLMFNGREVLLHRPNWATPLEFEVSDPINFVDPGMGVQAAFRRQTWIQDGRRSQHLVRSADDLNQTLGAFLRGRGRQGEFYQPTMTEDLVLMATVNAGSTFWRVPGHDFHDTYAASKVHRAFAVYLMNGDIHLFRVVQLTKAGTTEPYTLIQAATPAPVPVSPSAVAMICWMPVVRFASDDISVRWRTSRLAEIAINTLTLEDLP